MILNKSRVELFNKATIDLTITVSININKLLNIIIVTPTLKYDISSIHVNKHKSEY